MKKLMIALLYLNSFFVLAQNKVKAIEVFVMSRDVDTRYSYSEKDVIRCGEKIVLKEAEIVDLSEILRKNLPDTVKYSGNIGYSEVNLRMLCILIYEDLTVDYLGFDGGECMTFNLKVYPAKKEAFQQVIRYLPKGLRDSWKRDPLSK